jgi:probable phosphoglycerate mutase
MEALRLYYIRHGETIWSLTGQHTGRTDLALTANGEAQAQALLPWLGHITFSHVFTSPLQRARRTCALAGLGDAAIIEPDLAEWDYGDYEGIHSRDIRIGHPGWNVFTDGCPNGESPGEISNRADRLIRRLGSLTGNVALFSHGGFAGVLATRWIGLPVSEGAHFSLDTASLSILGENPNHPEIRAIRLWNAVPGILLGHAAPPTDRKANEITGHAGVLGHTASGRRNRARMP